MPAISGYMRPRLPHLLLLIALLGGCGRPAGPPPAPAPIEEAPVSLEEPPPMPTDPLPAPDAALPAISPEQPLEPAAAPVPAPPVLLSRELLATVVEGMPYDRVAEVLGREGARITSGTGATQIFKWTDAQGVSFQARFEEGTLVRKSLLQLAPKAVQEAPNDVVLSEALYDQVMPGMTLEAVRELLPLEPVVLADNQVSVAVFQWSDPSGLRFLTRFEEGKLARKTAVTVRQQRPARPGGELPPEAAPSEETGTADEAPASILEADDPEAMPAEDSSIGEAPLDEADTAEASDTPDAVEVARADEASEPQPMPQADPRVARVGQPGFPDSRDSAYRPRADVPNVPFSLRDGVYEVRFVNPTDSAVKASLTAGKRGRSVTVPPGSARTMRVAQGVYTLSFVFRNQPYTLHQGGTVEIDGQFYSDTEISLYQAGAEVQPLYFTP